MRKLLLVLIFALSLICSGICRGASLPHDLEQAEQLLKYFPDSALTMLSASPSRNSRDMKERATWCLLNVWAGYNAYHNDLSLPQLDTAVTYFLAHRDHQRKAQAYYLNAIIRQECGVGSESEWVDDLMHGCREAEKAQDGFLACMLYQRYGVELSNCHWYESAAEAYLKSYDYAEKEGLKAQKVTALINLSHGELVLGDQDSTYTKAIEYAMKACEIAKENNSDDQYSRALQNLSACYSRSKMFDEALSSAQESIRIQEQLYASGQRKDRVRYVTLADAWRKCGNGDSTVFYALKDYDNPNLITRRGAVQMLYSAYRDLLGDEQMALKYLTEYNELGNQLEKQHETDKVTQSQLAFQQEESEKKRSDILLTSVLAVFLSLLLMVLVIRVYHLYVKRAQAELEADKANLEADKANLEADMAKLAADKERLESEAQDAHSEADRVTAVLIDKDEFIEGLRSNPRYLSDKDWDRLEKTVDKVYDGYCQQLRDSGLTAGNIRIALLLKLHFSNADSATMLGISPTSVTKAKQRLKGRLP